jgi:hypothetical protein
MSIFRNQDSVRLLRSAVESAVKQIGKRMKISGARREASPLGQWKLENIPSMLQLRTAYLNGQIIEENLFVLLSTSA